MSWYVRPAHVTDDKNTFPASKTEYKNIIQICIRASSRFIYSGDPSKSARFREKDGWEFLANNIIALQKEECQWPFLIQWYNRPVTSVRQFLMRAAAARPPDGAILYFIFFAGAFAETCSWFLDMTLPTKGEILCWEFAWWMHSHMDEVRFRA